MKRHLRIAALQCNFQDQAHTLKMPETWHEMGFAGEQLLHTHADMYSAIYDPKVHRKTLTQYLKNSQKQGLETIVYMNCHIMGPSIAGHYKEWGVRNLDGKTYPKYYNTYYGCCLNSSWKDYFFDCVKSLGEFQLAGLFFDGPIYKPCGCPVCQKKFKAKYHKSMAEATEAERKQFNFDSIIAFKDELYDLVKSVNPNWLMYFNEGLFAGRSNREMMLRQLHSDDIIGTEGGFFFYGPPKEQPWWHCSSCAKMAEAVADGRRTIIFQAGDHKPWGWFMHTPAETQLCYASALFNGAGIWYGIHCNPDNLKTTTGKAAKEMLQFDKKHEKLWEDNTSLAKTALLYSYDTSAIYPKEGETSDLYNSEKRDSNYPGNYSRSFQGALAVMEHLQRPYDVVTDLNLGHLSKYKELIVPSLAITSDEILEKLHQYAAQGGTLILDGEFGRYDLKGKEKKKGNPLFHIAYTGKLRNHKTFNYIGVTPKLYKPDNAFGYIPAPQWSLELKANKNLEAIGWCTPPMAGCYEARPGKPELPFLFKAKIGKGCCYYLNGGFFESYFAFQHLPYRYLINNMLKASEFSLENAPIGVTLTARQSKAGTFLGLCNFTSPIRPIEKPAPAYELLLHVPKSYKTATDLATGKKLTKKAPGVFVLPKLDIFACITLA